MYVGYSNIVSASQLVYILLPTFFFQCKFSVAFIRFWLAPLPLLDGNVFSCSDFFLISEYACDIKKFFGDGMTGTAVFSGSWISIREPHLVGENKGSVCCVFCVPSCYYDYYFLVNWFLFLFMCRCLVKSTPPFGEQEEMETASFGALCFHTLYVLMCIIQTLFIPVFWVYTPKLLLGGKLVFQEFWLLNNLYAS